MKTFRLLTLCTLLMAVGLLHAQSKYIYAEPVDVEAGQESEIVVKMDFDTDVDVASWSFQMQLPDGVRLLTPDKPKRSCTLSSEMYDVESDPESIFEVASLSNGAILFAFITGDDNGFLTKYPIKSTHCELVRVSITSDVAQTVRPVISNVSILGTENSQHLIIDDVDVRLDYKNTLYVEDAEALVGTDFTLSVKMRNNVDIEGFGFDLVLPGGMSVVCDAEGNPQASLSEERTTAARTNTFEVRKMGNAYNDVLRVVAASSNGSAIAAGDGEVCTVRVRVGTGLKAGKYNAQLMNISVADTEAVSHDMESMPFTITVLALAVGDANGDGNVTVADLTAIAHDVLGNTPEGFSPKAADVNQDGRVNVADYTGVAHLLLYGRIEGPAASRVVKNGILSTDISTLDNTLYIAPTTATAGDVASLSVRMKNNVEAEGFQFSLTLPEGVSVERDDEGFPDVQLSEKRTTEKGTNTFASSLTADGTLKVMGASTNGSTISAGDGEVCKVKVRISGNMAAGSYTLLLSDVAISDTNAKSHDVAQVETTLTVSEASGISAALNDKGEMINEKCFDLQGRKIENSKSVNSKYRKGVYIQDGRKYMR